MSNDEEDSLRGYEYDVDDPEVRLGEKLEHLRSTLRLEMIRLRKEKSVTQEEMGERMGVGQPQISKLENPDRESSLESIARYLDALGADLAVGIRTSSGFVQVSDDRDYELQLRSKETLESDLTIYKFPKSENDSAPETTETGVADPGGDYPMAG